jgi:phosphoadenosine phosphosulfate reductase
MTSPSGRAVPFYCPYCGEEDLEPQGAADGQWHCRSCTRSSQLRFAGRDRGRAVSGPAGSLLERHVEDPQHMRSLAEQAAEELEDACADDVIRWATDTFGDRICVTSSMTDAVIIHLASAIRPGIDVVFLDTGYHFPETIGTRDAVAAVYPVTLVNVTPSRTVGEQDAELGPRLYGRDPDLCCYLRKVEPLERTLAGYDAWITGVRREETTSRRSARVVEWDDKREMVKVNPIVTWTAKQVDEYIADNGVLVNPLVYDGYPSIGCRTCTLRAEPGADPRSGRWAGTGKTECGIHA